jgi:peptidyl-prolyl cis-trans isomerase D
MSDFIHSKKSSVFATVLIGIIILAFMFTGYQTFDQRSTSGAIGSVDGMPIKPEEYQQEYNRQIEFYKQMMGGDLSQKQLEGMKIKESVIKNIVQRKLMTKFAKELGVYPSNEEVKAEIKSLPYFQTNGQFDVTRYKSLLAANKLTPLEFETDVVDQIRMKQFQQLAGQFTLSKAYLADLEKFRSEKVNAEVVTISKNNLRQFVEVSPEELNKFLSVETNQKRVASMFNERKASLDKPEEVKARHILLLTEGKNEADVKAQIEKISKEVSPANFSKMADKYTEDPSGKGKGGDLGSFGRGRMVPEFEQVAFTQKPGTISAPVKTAYGYHLILVDQKTSATVAKLDDYKNSLAKEILQKDKVEDIKKLTVGIANQLRSAMESGREAEVKSLVEKYKLQHSNTSVNRLEGAAGNTYLTAENMKTIFNGDLTKPQFHSFDDGANLVMMRTTPGTTTASTDADKMNVEGLKNALARKMMDNIMKQLEANAKVKINDQMLQM